MTKTMAASSRCGGQPGFLHGCGLLTVVAVHFFFFLILASAQLGTSHRKIKTNVGHTVHLQVSKNTVVMDNGIAQVSVSNPGGDVVAIKYGGLDNLLEETHDPPDGRGYLDINWNWPGQSGSYDRVHGSKFDIINQSDDIVEVSFLSTWNKSSSFPINIDQRYVMRRGVSGFYYYTIFDHPKGWPGFEIGQTRVAFKLNEEQFHYMAISDYKQRVMPMAKDRDPGLCQPLDYQEAVLLTNPSNPDLKGQVDDKYQFSSESQDTRVHGWISKDPVVGFWMISTSDEFRNGGPMKQELTSHTGPVTICTFMSTHYAGKDMETVFADGEPWKKVFGPFFVYLNSNPSQGKYSELWEDAKKQMLLDTESWPYDFIQSKDFPPASHRGTVSGQLLVRDRYISQEDSAADSAYVGLAAPGEAGSWQSETKGYQFWTRSDSLGNFNINKVRSGVYNLYAWIPGTVGNYKYEGSVTVSPGSQIKLGSIVFEPPRSGPTLWEIGVPDRTAVEFYVPEAYPTLLNKLYVNLKTDWFRQYGLWKRYTDLYPKSDLVFTIGKSDYSKDWFYAHVVRINGPTSFSPTTWQVRFALQHVIPTGNYTLQLALASASFSEIQVRFNNAKIGKPLFTTKLIGSDNAIARHGIHGQYHFYSIQVPGKILLKGSNTLFLTQSRSFSPYCGAMYDYLRLEGPPK